MAARYPEGDIPYWAVAPSIGDRNKNNKPVLLPTPEGLRKADMNFNGIYVRRKRNARRFKQRLSRSHIKYLPYRSRVNPEAQNPMGFYPRAYSEQFYPFNGDPWAYPGLINSYNGEPWVNAAQLNPSNIDPRAYPQVRNSFNADARFYIGSWNFLHLEPNFNLGRLHPTFVSVPLVPGSCNSRPYYLWLNHDNPSMSSFQQNLWLLNTGIRPSPQNQPQQFGRPILGRSECFAHDGHRDEGQQIDPQKLEALAKQLVQLETSASSMAIPAKRPEIQDTHVASYFQHQEFYTEQEKCAAMRELVDDLVKLIERIERSSLAATATSEHSNPRVDVDSLGRSNASSLDSNNNLPPHGPHCQGDWNFMLFSPHYPLWKLLAKDSDPLGCKNVWDEAVKREKTQRSPLSI